MYSFKNQLIWNPNTLKKKLKITSIHYNLLARKNNQLYCPVIKACY